MLAENYRWVMKSKKLMKVAYIVGPYRAKTVSGIAQNIQTAEKYAIKYWRRGYAVICPHKNTAFFDGECPDEVWLEGDMEFLRRSDVVIAIPGWEDSKGSVKEIKMARKLKKKIIYALSL